MNNKFCDCSQGRFACTCTAEKNLANAEEFEHRLKGFMGSSYAQWCGRIKRKADGPPLSPERAWCLEQRSQHEQPDFYRQAAHAATAKAHLNWVELNAVKWKLRIVETLALIGWAGLVLTQLGVL